MCGIAGIISPNNNTQQYKAAINNMIKALHHRGPDSNGSLFFPNAVLGNTRLSIVGLEGGEQPIKSALSNTAITFNGEIYGYQQLKQNLNNYPFQTKTDTEVILALYEQYGLDLFPHLKGMFAFALWDNTQQQLLLARDRFGEKPLYYTLLDDKTLIFASEIKAILATGLVKPILNKTALSHYLKHTYVHPIQCIYNNIHVLPPAHFLLYQNQTIKIQRYWDFPPINKQISLAEATLQFKFLLAQAIQKQLVADVPVGAFLSGGLDSSTVVAIANQQLKERAIKTFSFGFKDGIKSELPFAKQLAQKHQTQHYELLDDKANIAELLLHMPTIYDEPLGDSSSIPTYLICKYASQHLKVVLTGDGADELLGGYFFWARYLFPEIFETPIINSPTIKPKETNFWTALMLQTKNKFKQLLGQQAQQNEKLISPKTIPTIAEKYYQFRYYFSEAEQAQLGLLLPTQQLTNYKRYQTNSLNDAMRFDVESYMSGGILVKTDRAAMANSLELRAPFLDTDFANFCLSLPDEFKVNKTQEKIVLREAYQHLWTPEITARNKQGFGGPMPQWLQLPAVVALKQNYLENSNGKIFEVLSFDGVQPFVNKNNQQTWSLLVLAIWMEQYNFSIA